MNDGWSGWIGKKVYLKVLDNYDRRNYTGIVQNVIANDESTFIFIIDKNQKLVSINVNNIIYIQEEN